MCHLLFVAHPTPVAAGGRAAAAAQGRARVEQQHERKQEQCSSPTDSKNRAAARARAGAAAGSAVVEVATEEAMTWGRDVVDDVAGDSAVDGDTPCLLGIEHRQPHEIE